MADSETSRTSPSDTRGKKKTTSRSKAEHPSRLTRQNLLGAVAKILQPLTSELEQAPDRKVPGPTSTARLWLNWYEAHQRLARIKRYQETIESRVLAMAGAYPVVQIKISPDEPPLTVYSLSEIARLKTRVDAETLASARSLLRKRRDSWNSADRRLGYSPALAFEHDLAQQEQRLSRVMNLSRPKTVIEVTAKLHCLLSTQDPETQRIDAPWSELRRLLIDLITVEQSFCD